MFLRRKKYNDTYETKQYVLVYPNSKPMIVKTKIRDFMVVHSNNDLPTKSRQNL